VKRMLSVSPLFRDWFYVKFKPLKHSFLLEWFLKMFHWLRGSIQTEPMVQKKGINEIVKYGSKAEPRFFQIMILFL
jgi:hypothetical protein